MPRHPAPPESPVARWARRAGPAGIVLTVAGLVLLGIVLTAALDLRALTSERAPQGRAAAAADARGDEPGAQYSVRVTVSADGPFVAQLRYLDGTVVERRSDGEDVVETKVFDGIGPYVYVGGQLTQDGRITCRVEIDGKETDERSAAGTFAQALCAS